MPSATLSSVRHYLFALAAVVVFALVGMFGFALYSDMQNSVAREKSRIRALVTIVAANTSQTLAQHQQVMERLAQRPRIRAMDLSRCDPILLEFRDLFPQFANLATIDPTGLIPCSGVPQPGGRPASVARTEWYKRGMAERRFLVGLPFTGPITGKRVSVLVQPVFGKRNELLGLIGLPLDLERFQPRVPAADLPPGTRYGFLSGQGVLIWRNVDPSHESMIGKNALGSVPAAREIVSHRNGEFEALGSDGEERYYATAPVPEADWVAFMSVPKSAIVRNVLDSAIRNAVVGFLGLLLALALITLLLRRINRTDRELLEAKEAAEAASHAKSLFLSNMSHELRTPLNAILGFAELLERDPEVPLRQRKNLETINRSGHHLLSLINDILEISRIEAGRLVFTPQTFDLPELLAALVETMELRARQEGLALQLETDRELPRFVSTDMAKLRQVLINLISNAIKYTPHGEVLLTASAVRSNGGYLVTFVVKDTGVGIAPEELERIFQPFYQTEQGIRKGEGTGLGLTIARQYAELLGGTLSARSVVGRGSAFTLTVPMAQGGESVAARPVHRRVMALATGERPRRILIAEDKPDNQQLLRQLLEEVGFEVELAANGEEALRLFQTSRPDFIWMDMRMPVMDGYEATRRIRQLPGGGEIPIVALTASAFEEDRAAIRAVGCDDMVRKPLDAELLFEVMAQRLGVTYRYDEEAEEQEVDAPSAVLLDRLPAEIRRRLHRAAEVLDSAGVRALATEVEGEHPEAAQLIRRLADQYRFHELYMHEESDVGT